MTIQSCAQWNETSLTRSLLNNETIYDRQIRLTTPPEFTMQSFPLQYLLSHKDINVNVCYASGDIFILDILCISFRTNIFSPIIFFCSQDHNLRDMSSLGGSPLPRSPVFCHPAKHYITWSQWINKDLAKTYIDAKSC